MNKHVIAILMLSAILASPKAFPVMAQDASPTAGTRAATSSGQLEELKARLATKVAELRTVVKRAMFGTVKSVSLTQAAIETKTKDIKIELTDDVSVAQMISGKRTILAVEDIESGDNLTVFGTYDETLDLLKAQFIFIQNATEAERLSGIVASVDDEDFILTVNTPEGRTIRVDIEKTTKSTNWSKNDGIVKGGFSKIAVGDTVHIVGTAVPKTENRIKATKVLDLGNITGAASVPTVTATATPASTASATPRATPRPTSAE